MHVLQDHIPRSTLASVFSLLTDKNAKRGPSSLSLFPTASLHTIPATGLWYSLCFFPSSESRTLIRCDLYSRRPTIDATSKLVSEKLVEILRKRIENVENDFKSHYQESGYVYEDLAKRPLSIYKVSSVHCTARGTRSSIS